MFTPRLKVNKCGNDTKNIKDITIYKYIYPYVKFNLGLPNCTTYAYSRTMELCIENGAKWTDIKHYNNPYWWNGQCTYGNAQTWYNQAKNAKHWQVSSKPKLGAIACWNGDRRGYGGHVAIVEEIDGDYITTSNSSYGGQLFFTKKDKLVVGQVNSWVGEKFMGYIYNPFIKEQPKKSVDVIAQEVIDGKWGNGVSRKNALEDAGYNYVEVQQKVNEMLNQKVYYTVKKGDTVSAIAKKYGTTINKIKTLNNLSNANLIRVGQSLRVK